MPSTEGPANESLDTVRSNEEVNFLRNEVDQLMQEKILNKYLISGPLVNETIQNNTDPKSVCNTLFSKITGLNIQNIDTNLCKFVEFNNNTKMIQIKINSFKSRKELFTNFFAMETKPFYINECLIKSRAVLFKKLRDVFKLNKNIIKSVYSRDGKLYCVIKNDNKRILINNDVDLNNLVTEFELNPISTN